MVVTGHRGRGKDRPFRLWECVPVRDVLSLATRIMGTGCERAEKLNLGTKGRFPSLVIREYAYGQIEPASSRNRRVTKFRLRNTQAMHVIPNYRLPT